MTGGPGATGSHRVLLLSFGVPLPTWGAGTRIFQLVRHLSARHEVTVLTYAAAGEDAAIDQLRSECAAVHVVERPPGTVVGRRLRQGLAVGSARPFHAAELRSGGMQHAIDELLSRQAVDVVQVESTQMCCFRLDSAAPVVLDEHNVEYELMRTMHQGERSLPRRLHNRLEHVKVRRFEQELWRTVDGVAVTSQREAALVTSSAPGTPLAVVPNGVDPTAFSTTGGGTDTDDVLFFGLLSYRPNLDAALWLVEDIFPRIRRERPSARLTVVGGGRPGDLERLRRPGVTVTGWVDDVRPHIRRAAVVVAPLHMGGGTRLKVLEALAMSKALVSTAIGCEGIDVLDGQHLLIADDGEQFAGAVARLLGDADLAQRLGAAGCDLVRREYSWEHASAELERLHATVLERARPSGTGPVSRRHAARRTPRVPSHATRTVGADPGVASREER